MAIDKGDIAITGAFGKQQLTEMDGGQGGGVQGAKDGDGVLLERVPAAAVAQLLLRTFFSV